MIKPVSQVPMRVTSQDRKSLRCSETESLEASVVKSFWGPRVKRHRNLNSFSALLENCRRKAWAGQIAMAGTGGGGSGSGGGDNNEERLRKMIADHLRASELSTIDTRTPEGLASLTAILGQALQVGLTAGEAQRDEEARKAAEAKAAEKKRKRDERATTGALSPRTLEKKRRKDERDAIRKEKLDLKKKEEERKKLPLITLAEEGIPTELAYTGAKSTIRHIVSTNFAQGVEWGTLSKAEQKRVINQVKGAFRNGGELDSGWIADKISNSMSQARYHDRMKIRAHRRDLNVYRNLERLLQFSEDIWNAFY